MRPSTPGRTPHAGWLLLLTAAALVAVVLGSPELTPPPLDDTGIPPWIALVGAVLLTTTLTVGLASRTGGRALLSGALAAGVATAAVLSQAPVLVAGAAVATAVVAGLLAVLATVPAARLPGIVRECLLATAVAGCAACAVVAYAPEVSVERVEYVGFGLTLAAALPLAHRAAEGAQGASKRGWWMLTAGAVVSLLVLGYAEALTRWGPAGLVADIETTVAGLRATFGALPIPVVAFVGAPALAWSVSSRASGRDGWWAGAFAAPGMTAIAVSLLDSTRTPAQTGLAILYSLGLGLFLGYVVLRTDTLVTAARRRRLRSEEGLPVHPPEPDRTSPLL